jgi:hypothetical protein
VFAQISAFQCEATNSRILFVRAHLKDQLYPKLIFKFFRLDGEC